MTGYKLFFKTHDSTEYAEESVDCVGTSSFVLENRACYVNLSTLIAAPFNLVLDEEIYTAVAASNYYGDSERSEAYLAGLIQLVPDAPISLTNDDTVTDATQIKLTWSDGASNGGTNIIDYFVYYDQGTSTQVQLASGLTVQ